MDELKHTAQVVAHHDEIGRDLIAEQRIVERGQSQQQAPDGDHAHQHHKDRREGTFVDPAWCSLTAPVRSALRHHRRGTRIGRPEQVDRGATIDRPIAPVAHGCAVEPVSRNTYTVTG